jgi:GntR family transcriptional regulator
MIQKDNHMTPEIRIDFRSNMPIYLQIMEQIRQKVASGELQPGDQLPTVRQMAADLRVNFNTVARAYRMLDETGLISTQHGRGTYIWEMPSEAERQDTRRHGLEALTLRYLEEAAHHGYQVDEIADIFWKQLSAWENSKKTK